MKCDSLGLVSLTKFELSLLLCWLDCFLYRGKETSCLSYLLKETNWLTHWLILLLSHLALRHDNLTSFWFIWNRVLVLALVFFCCVSVCCLFSFRLYPLKKIIRNYIRVYNENYMMLLLTSSQIIFSLSKRSENIAIGS